MRLTTLAVMAQTAAAVAIPRLGLGSAEGPPHEAMASAVEAAVRIGVLMIDTAQNTAARRPSATACAGATRRRLCCAKSTSPRGAGRTRGERAAPSDRIDAKARESRRRRLHWPLLLGAPSEAAARRARRRVAELEAMVDEGLVGCLGLSILTCSWMRSSLARHRPSSASRSKSPVLPGGATRGVRGASVRSSAIPHGVGWQSAHRFRPGLASVLDDATVAAVAAEAGCTPAQACLAWAMAGRRAHPEEPRPEPSPRTARYLDDACSRPTRSRGSTRSATRAAASRRPWRPTRASSRRRTTPGTRHKWAVCFSLKHHSGGAFGVRTSWGWTLSHLPSERRGRICRASRIAQVGYSIEPTFPKSP